MLHGEDLQTAVTRSRVNPLQSLGVLIPAWRPGPQLPLLVEALVQRGFGLLLVIDDGSPDACTSVFAEVAAQAHVELLRHRTNMGKGCALKTGFGYVLDTCPELVGLVTADADGQHTPDDIERVARALLADPSRPVFGSRAFERAVPWRSKWGNLLTRRIFGALTGVPLMDTQTGLRGLPVALLPALLTLKGERYEYEMKMLAYLCRSGHVPREVSIATIYLENNRGSHFHPIWDSLCIYWVLLRCCASTRLFPLYRGGGSL